MWIAYSNSIKWCRIKSSLSKLEKGEYCTACTVVHVSTREYDVQYKYDVQYDVQYTRVTGGREDVRTSVAVQYVRSRVLYCICTVIRVLPFFVFFCIDDSSRLVLTPQQTRLVSLNLFIVCLYSTTLPYANFIFILKIKNKGSSYPCTGNDDDDKAENNNNPPSKSSIDSSQEVRSAWAN